MQSLSKSVIQSKQLQNLNQHNKSHWNPVPVEVFLMLKLGGTLKLDKPLYAKSVKNVVRSKHLQNLNQQSENHQNPVPVEVFLMLKLGGKFKFDTSLYAKSVKKSHSGQIIEEIESVQ